MVQNLMLDFSDIRLDYRFVFTDVGWLRYLFKRCPVMAARNSLHRQIINRIVCEPRNGVGRQKKRGFLI